MKRIMYLVLAFVFLFTLLTGCSGSGGSSEGTKDGTADTQAAVDYKDLKVNEKIHIDQLGYRIGDEKLVMIGGKGGSFDVVDSESGKKVFGGKTEDPVDDTAGSSGDEVYYGDFSSLKTPGSYYIAVPGYGKSYTFRIDDGVYNQVKDSTLKGLYFQRCGIDLEEKYAGQWTHGACHQFDGILYTAQDKLLDGKGGWHDAGDYGRYSVAAAVTAADILTAYDFFPSVFTDNSNIPESGNKVPDVLDEARYGLEWLLKMQDKSSGGVYHKLTSSGFPDLATMPDADVADVYFTPISSTATGDFAAVMAMAARIYKPFDSAFSSKCLAAAEKAWGWLSKNRDFLFKNPTDITTGEYGDNIDTDERFWAAAELFRTSGSSDYNSYIKSSYDSGLSLAAFGWQNVAGFGSVAYCYTDSSKTDKAVRDALVQGLVDSASSNLSTSNSDGYLTSLSESEYTWGSNMNLMNDAMGLIIADKLSPKKEFLQAAEDDLHYLLGRNTLDQTYITGLGSRSVMNPHHRPSVADGVTAPVPGLVAGGPDKNLEDDIAKQKLNGQPPAKCYVDDATCYSTNEIDTYWNSPTIFVAACFSNK